MLLIPLLAIAAGILAGVVPQDASSVASVQHEGYISNDTALAANAITAGVGQEGGEMLRLYDHAQYMGTWWAFYPTETTGYSPDTGTCRAMVPNILSSVQFMWDNNGRLGFSCYFFEDCGCKGTNGRKIWLGNSVPDLKRRGWDNRVCSINCYWSMPSSGAEPGGTANAPTEKREEPPTTLMTPDGKPVPPMRYGGFLPEGQQDEPSKLSALGDESIIKLFAHADYWGAYWFFDSEGMGIGPSGGECRTLPVGQVSSVQFQYQRINGRLFTCKWYYNPDCSGEYYQINLNLYNLHLFKLGDKFYSAKCWWLPHMLATEDQSNTTTTNTAYSSATASEVVQRRREGEAIKDMLPAHKIARGTKSIMNVYERLNYQGDVWSYLDEYLSADVCFRVPEGKKISSIKMFFDARRVHCTGYTNDICQGTEQPNTELGITTDFYNLTHHGFDATLLAFKCFGNAPDTSSTVPSEDPRPG